MAGRRTHNTIAKPETIRFNDDRGYELIIKITEGPNHLLDRRVRVKFNCQQLNAISEWDSSSLSFLNLESPPTPNREWTAEEILRQEG